MLPARKKSKGKKDKKELEEEAAVEQLKKELAYEKESKSEVEWVANELEKRFFLIYFCPSNFFIDQMKLRRPIYYLGCCS